ncbi:MAG: phenylalanine--tRNA ligase subunit alpha [Anaerolineaceae bacterium]|nr:phenylalanine--tRNA ligase subunit alpha [Anaerolineaceae bacterium]
MPEDIDVLVKLEELRQDALAALEAANDEGALQEWRSIYLSRRGQVTQIMKEIPDMPKELRPKVGQLVNKVKNEFETRLAERQEQVSQAALDRSIRNERLDVTLPGRKPSYGRLHPATQTLREIYRIFAEMGFQVYRATDVDTEEYNFELLNIPAHHPARDMWDTFFTRTPGVVLRTHTSPGQIHSMRETAPDPVRVILPGMCYRYEQVTSRSEFQFNQVEVLAVGRNIDFGGFKGTLQDFARRMFGDNARIRLRPSYFPFTEPSAEMDVECFLCQGEGCQVCKGAGWLEIMGCGMVHPIVLQNGGYDPKEYSGFAAGMGPERITMLRHHIDDIRYFWENDVRFLEQF